MIGKVRVQDPSQQHWNVAFRTGHGPLYRGFESLDGEAAAQRALTALGCLGARLG